MFLRNKERDLQVYLKTRVGVGVSLPFKPENSNQILKNITLEVLAPTFGKIPRRSQIPFPSMQVYAINSKI